MKSFPLHIIKKNNYELNDDILKSLNILKIINNNTNNRLLAALSYFYVARRLLDAGNTKYEFFAEAILNFTKVLQILFGQTRDEVRNKLKELGFDDEIIETRYIPMMILRNKFDVGHVSLFLHERKNLNIIYNYLEHSEEDFRTLLITVIDKVNEKQFSISEIARHSNQSETELKKLLISLEKRIKQKNTPNYSDLEMYEIKTS